MILETSVLLYLSRNFKLLLHAATSQFKDKNGEPFRYEGKNARIHTQYVEAFHSLRVDTEASKLFFEEMPIYDYCMIAAVFLFAPDLLQQVENRSTEQLLHYIQETYSLIRDSGGILGDISAYGENLQRYLDSGDCSDALLAVCREPLAYLSAYADLLRRNIPAAEHAWTTVYNDVQDFLTVNWKPETFFKRSLLWQKDIVREVFPILATYGMSFFIENVYYCGLFNVDTRPDAVYYDAKERVTGLCKVLGDKSRLDILLLLKERPYYNREVAEKLGLSPATVMHHTDALLSCGLAKMLPGGKNQKRVYFTYAPEALADLQRALNQLFQT